MTVKIAKRLVWGGVFVALAGFAWGCGEELVGDPGDLPPGYLPQTSPENVLQNLQVSYQRREIEEYVKLLDPVYIFKFQQADIPPDLPREYWNRDEDSTMVAALFDNPDVVRISLDFGPFAAEDAGRLDEPQANRIRLTHVRIEVELRDGTTLQAGSDLMDMYLGRGRAAAGTDSTKWYIFEWQDFEGEWSSLLREVGK